MPTYQWPKNIRPVTVMFHPDTKSRSGGLSVTGYEQVVGSDAGRWRAEMTFPPGAAMDVLAWRAIKVLLQGRTNSVVIGPYDGIRNPYGLTGGKYDGSNVVPHSDDATFSDGSGYWSSVIGAKANAVAELRATSIEIDMVYGHVPQAGQYFSISERLYMIKRADLIASDVYGVSFWPPLRTTVAQGKWIEFDRPMATMRLSSDETGELALDPAGHGSPTLQLVEA